MRGPKRLHACCLCRFCLASLVMVSLAVVNATWNESCAPGALWLPGWLPRGLPWWRQWGPVERWARGHPWRRPRLLCARKGCWKDRSPQPSGNARVCSCSRMQWCNMCRCGQMWVVVVVVVGGCYNTTHVGAKKQSIDHPHPIILVIGRSFHR